MTDIRSRTVLANDLEFGVLEAGTGPLALCLHGFPDSAHTWRHLLPALADAGFHAVAPFLRGFAPTGIPADGGYGIAALAADAVALHEALGGGGDAVLIGHDWGAEAAYLAAAHEPERWRRLVSLAIPPAGADAALFSDYDQVKRFFYMWFFRDPLNFAEPVVAAGDLAFIDRLWADWSPGFDPGAHLDTVKACLRDPAHLTAAIGYYRAVGLPGGGAADPARYAAYDESAGKPAPQPTLYLHGTQDGCIGAGLASLAGDFLAEGSRMGLIENAGHFLHLEQPRDVGDQILAWVS
ncbi:MAG TPA: alpha/beta fold hydrolase [Streptosporangiaceae bacterium]